MSEQNSINLIQLQVAPEDHVSSFEPLSFGDYLGQKDLIHKLSIYVQAAKMRNEHLDHVLLFGPPGLGKTTLARVIARELGTECRITSAPVLERTGDLVALLSGMAAKEVLFIDEIHRLPKNVEEVLYSAMENFCIDMIIGQGGGAKSIRLPLQPFTLIGATTKTGSISTPLQTRFGIVERIDFYEPDELAKIVHKNADFMNISIDSEAALSIGHRARGTPRIVKRILRRVRDFSQVHQHVVIDKIVVDQALAFLDIDEEGLTKLDRSILAHIIHDFDGGPVSLETLAAMTGEDKDTIEDVCEPFLLRKGFLQRTPRGRQIHPRKLLVLRQKLAEAKMPR